MPPSPADLQSRRRTAALKRLRDAAAADRLPPARIAELESALTGAFAINDLMAPWFGRGGD